MPSPLYRRARAVVLTAAAVPVAGCRFAPAGAVSRQYVSLAGRDAARDGAFKFLETVGAPGPTLARATAPRGDG
jgi:hypothetical protein